MSLARNARIASASVMPRLVSTRARLAQVPGARIAIALVEREVTA